MPTPTSFFPIPSPHTLREKLVGGMTPILFVTISLLWTRRICKEHGHRNNSIDLKKDNHREMRDSDILRDPGPQPFLYATLSRALCSGSASASEPTQSLAETLAFPGPQLPPRKVEGKVSTPCENFTREGNANSCQEKCLDLCILIQPNNGASALQPELCTKPRGFRAAPCPQVFGLSAGKDGS